MSKLSTQLKEIRWVIRDAFVNGIASSVCTPLLIRHAIYRLAGIGLHTLSISPRCTFVGNRISIGSGTFVNRGVYFDASNNINIGRDCAISMEVLLCTSNHDSTNPRKRAGNVVSAPISIGDGCWIGARTIILPGVSIGDGCIIAGGAVVTRNCEMHGLYAGSPARRVKDL